MASPKLGRLGTDRRRHTSRLDQPAVPRRLVPRPRVDSESFGRISERIARFLGTARFLAIQSVIVVMWIGYNGYFSYTHFVLHQGPAPFDRYPFILLNLAFSTQAAYAAPLILLAQNRQDDRDRLSLEQDRERAARTVADTEFLARELAAVRIALGDVVTRDFLRSELRTIVEEDAARRADGAPGGGHKSRDKKAARRARQQEQSPPGDRDSEGAEPTVESDA